MKWEYFIIILSLTVVIGLGWVAHLHTMIGEQQERVVKGQEQIVWQKQDIEVLQEQLTPPAYAQPLNKIIVSSGTGVRLNPMGGGTEALHKGVDLIGELGDPVDAVLSGKVVENWLPPGWHYGIYYEGHPVFGGYIVIDHGEQLYSLYGHLSKTLVHEDDWVEAGRKIGEMGNTGISTGNHLHLEIVINPFKYLENRR